MKLDGAPTHERTPATAGGLAVESVTVSYGDRTVLDRVSLTVAPDEVVCLHTPTRFLAVGQWFEDFRQVSDNEVRVLLGSHDPDR